MANQPIKVSGKQVGGAVHAVPCAWCGHGNDLRDLDAQSLLDSGSEYDCDRCGHINQVLKIQTVKQVLVRQHPTKHGAAKRHTAPQQATTIHPSQVNRRR